MTPRRWFAAAFATALAALAWRARGEGEDTSPDLDDYDRDWVICDCARDHPHRRGQERWTR